MCITKLVPHVGAVAGCATVSCGGSNNSGRSSGSSSTRGATSRPSCPLSPSTVHRTSLGVTCLALGVRARTGSTTVGGLSSDSSGGRSSSGSATGTAGRPCAPCAPRTVGSGVVGNVGSNGSGSGLATTTTLHAVGGSHVIGSRATALGSLIRTRNSTTVGPGIGRRVRAGRGPGRVGGGQALALFKACADPLVDTLRINTILAYITHGEVDRAPALASADNVTVAHYGTTVSRDNSRIARVCSTGVDYWRVSLGVVGVRRSKSMSKLVCRDDYVVWRVPKILTPLSVDSRMRSLLISADYWENQYAIDQIFTYMFLHSRDLRPCFHSKQRQYQLRHRR